MIVTRFDESHILDIQRMDNLLVQPLFQLSDDGPLLVDLFYEEVCPTPASYHGHWP